MTTLNRTFPSTRLRRLRSSPIAATVQENHLLIQDLIYPLFVVEGSRQQAIEAMPEVFRHSLDSLLREVEQAVALGINTFAIFPCVDTALKNDKATEAFNSNNLMVRAVKALKNRFPRVVVIADVALDPYTDHGHDGIVIDDDVANDVTLQALQKMALLLAQSGFDVIAPSDMMDGRVGAIRATLEQNHLPNTIIMSYAAKYNSALYGPFRSALQNTSAVAINKGSYQMHVANSDEAVHEVALDIEEGADCVIIKFRYNLSGNDEFRYNLSL